MILLIFSYFPKHIFLYPYQKQKSNQLLIDINTDFDGREFCMEEPYLIEKIGFFVDNVKTDISFNYQIHIKD